jgi:deoxyribonuclease V
VAGVDAAFSPDGKHCIAAAVLWDIQRQEPLEQHTASRTVAFPYIPGLLSFREAPAVIAALRKLHIQPDALMFDGHGLAHPRRFGIACHVGVICDLPSIGCAKSRLCGTYTEPGESRGSKTPLEDDGKVIGVVLRTRDKVKPVFVSIGHKIDLAAAEDIVLTCAPRYRLPEPTRLADRLVANARLSLKSGE